MQVIIQRQNRGRKNKREYNEEIKQLRIQGFTAHHIATQLVGKLSRDTVYKRVKEIDEELRNEGFTIIDGGIQI